MNRRNRSAFAALLAGIAALAGSTGAAQKTKTDTDSWPCQLTLRDGVDEAGSPVDAIMSDGRGTYVNGEDANRVRCKIAYAPGTAHDGWLEMFIDAGSGRYMTFPGQQARNAYTRSGYMTFANRGSFEVKDIRTADGIGQTYLRAFRAYVEDAQFGGRIRLMGDSFAAAPPDRFTPDLRGTSSVSSMRFDDCTWQVTSDPSSPLGAGEGAQFPRVLALIEAARNGSPIRSADFTLPFSATVRIIGVKPGCAP
jgi:hypothetical protein